MNKTLYLLCYDLYILNIYKNNVFFIIEKVIKRQLRASAISRAQNLINNQKMLNIKNIIAYILVRFWTIFSIHKCPYYMYYAYITYIKIMLEELHIFLFDIGIICANMKYVIKLLLQSREYELYIQCF